MKQNTKRWVFEPISQWVSRYIGMFVFLLGIGLLGFTFYTSYQMFLHSTEILPVKAAVSEMILHIVWRVLLLLAMGLISSVIALRGADLFSAVHQKLLLDKDKEVED